MSRFYLTAAIQQRFGTFVPWGTLAINITRKPAARVSHSVRDGDAIDLARAAGACSRSGFCGGYTTFSSYSYETLVLLEEGQLGRAAMYSLGSVVLALLATFAGFVLARELIAFRERF